MKVQPFFFLLLCSLFSIPLHSQSNYFSVKESEKFTDKQVSTRVFAVHTNDTDQTIVARGFSREFVFEVFNQNTEKVFDQTIPLAKKESFFGELFYGNELKIFTVHKATSKTRIIYAHILNIETQKYRKIKLFNTTIEKGGISILSNRRRKTNFTLSPNENYLAIATDNISKNKNAYLIHVFDAQSLSLLYQKSYYEDEEKRFSLSSLVIENDGSVYSLGKEYQNGRSEKKAGGKANYEFVLCKVDEFYKEVKSIRLDDGKHIRTLKIANKEGEFRLVGFYSEQNVSRIKGVSIIKMNPSDMTITSNKEYPLPIEVFEDLYGYRKADKNSSKELQNFYLDHILEDDFGNIYMLAEEFYVTQTYMASPTGGGYTIDQYHYDDILILKFDQQGELAWGRSIYKRASSHSYNAFLKDDKLHVLLNTGKNLKEKNDGRVKARKGFFEISALYDFVYDTDGEVSREKIQDNKGKSSLYIPYKGNFKNGKFIMYSQFKYNRRMMVLEGK